MCVFYLGVLFYRMHHMYGIVHADEKWYNLANGASKYYLAPTEQLPYRSCPIKRYIGKIMFLAALARPRDGCYHKHRFDGRLGIWSIIEATEAQQSSMIRPNGAKVGKSIPTTRSLYRNFLAENLLSAIRAKLSGKLTYVTKFSSGLTDLMVFDTVPRGTPVFTQQDSAGLHMCEDDREPVAQLRWMSGRSRCDTIPLGHQSSTHWMCALFCIYPNPPVSQGYLRHRSKRQLIMSSGIHLTRALYPSKGDGVHCCRQWRQRIRVAARR